MNTHKVIEEYKETYIGMYGHNPPEKCVESFCRINGIPWPLERKESTTEPNQYDVKPESEVEG